MISEIDIKDWHQLPVEKLYNVKRNSYIKLPWMEGTGDDIIFFDHIDGMYSLCRTLKNEIIHLQAWAEVIPLQRKTPDSAQV